MIKAVIFDFFGVVVTEGLRPFIGTYFYDQPKKRRQVAKLVDDYNKDYKSINYVDLVSQLAGLAGVSRAVVSGYLDFDQPNRPLLDFIKKELKPCYKVGILSNAGDDWVSKLLSPADMALFDEILLSYRFKMTKPDPQFYKLIASKLGAEPYECIFIDDIEKYCSAALAVGMKAILYQNTAQLKTDFKTLLTDSND